MLQRLAGHIEAVGRAPAQIFFGQLDFVFAQRAAVSGARSLLVGAAVTDDGAHRDDAGTVRHRPGLGERRVDRAHVPAIGDAADMPAHSLESPRDILREGHIGSAVQRHLVVIVEKDQLAQAPVARQRRRLQADALHQVAVADQRVGVVIDDFVPVAIEIAGQKSFRQRHADRRRRPLAQRTGGGLHAGRVAVFRVAGCAAAPLAEVLDLLQRQVIAGQVKQRIQEHGAVPGAEYKAVAIGPGRVARVEAHMSHPQRISHRRGAHRQARVTAVSLLYRIHR